MKLIAMAALSALAVSQVAAAQAVQWRVEDGGNGHWYAAIGIAAITWGSADESARIAGGYLASPSSASEWAFVRMQYDANGTSSHYWLGGVRSAGDPSWSWSNGEPWEFAAWGSASCPSGPYPNNPTEDAVANAISSNCGVVWDDFNPISSKHADFGGYIIEWSADCNNDGIVDYGQILDGTLVDANTDGIPDVCVTLRVPEEYPTIQAAVDAAPALSTVLVGPGVYGPFDYMGKHIVVRSVAGAESTTIDATGYAGSAVTFGELANFSTTLRGFRILTGSGTAYPDNPDGWRAGGGCYLWAPSDSIQGCAGTIEDCVFIGASGGCGYGAGIWTRRGNVAVRRCRFDNLHTQHHGPALSIDPTALQTVPGDTGYACVIEDCYIGHSSSYNNGGMLIGNDSPSVPISCRVTRCEFEGNSATFQAGALLTGAAPWSAGGQLVVERCVFHGNSAPVSNSITSQYLNGTAAFSIRLIDSIVTESGTSVRIGTGSAQLQGNRLCGGQSAVVGRWADLGGNQWTCSATSDCDGDGRIDQYEIVLGTDSDVDENGVIDSCESLRVPQDYPTIQSAIDAFPAGEHKVVSVAPGTYNESFSLNGKDVVIRGAANNATILDGTNLTASIAQFTGAEPATAGLENLVFRSGTAGSRIFPKAAFTVGGAIYGINSAAFIRNCRFEQNEADFGGAV